MRIQFFVLISNGLALAPTATHFEFLPNTALSIRQMQTTQFVTRAIAQDSGALGKSAGSRLKQHVADLHKPPAFEPHSKQTEKASFRPLELPGACRESVKLDSPALIEALRAMNIHLDKAKPITNPNLLAYLVAYFRVMEIKFDKPLFLRQGEEDSYLRVKREEDHLRFSANAADDLVTSSLREAGKKGELQYSNTLFTQLTASIGSPAVLSEILSRRYGLKFKLGTGLGSPQLAEGLAALDQLESAMKRDARYQNAMVGQIDVRRPEHGPGTAINLDSRSLSLGWTAGNHGVEDKIFFGVGALYWDRLSPKEQTRFREFSWESANAHGDFKHRPNVPLDFLPGTAGGSPQLDFATAFEEYMSNPENLRRLAPKKFDYMKHQVFPTVKVETTAMPRYRLKIDSSDPDTTPPTLTGDLARLISITAWQVENSNTVRVRCEVTGLSDDRSGVKRICVALEDEKGDIECVFNHDPLQKMGANTYAFVHDRPSYGVRPGKYRPFSFSAEDHSGNELKIETDAIPALTLPGTMPKGWDAERDGLVANAIRQAKITTIAPSKKLPEISYRLSMPYPKPDIETAHAVYLSWRRPGSPELVQIYLDPVPDYLTLALRNKNRSSLFELPFRFGPKMPSGDYELAEVSVLHSGGPHHDGDVASVRFEPGKSPFTLSHQSPSPDATVAEIDIDKITLALEPLNEPNFRGGMGDILVWVPVKGIEQTYWGNAQMLSPSGKLLFSTDRFRESLTTDKSGTVWAKIRFCLPLNPEAGGYTLAELALSESYGYDHKKNKISQEPQLTGGPIVSVETRERKLTIQVNR